MPVNSTHPDYIRGIIAWSRARDVLAGEDAVKGRGERYLPRLELQTDTDYAAYVARASFFNATARTAEGYVGLIFRRAPFVTLPEPNTALGRAMATFINDADMLGTSLTAYAMDTVTEVISVGRAGSLIDWEETEGRAYVSAYAAEAILNWRVERINGRNLPTLIVLHEPAGAPANGTDEFESQPGEQIRVLRLVENKQPSASASAPADRSCIVEIWRPHRSEKDKDKIEWKLAETRVPRRLGKPLPAIPFVFHGPRHSRADVQKLPLADVITVNLDHYRLDANYKHGVHFTALPTPWVSGFGVDTELRIGSSTAWVASEPGASAGYLEFTGQGLTTFERAMDRDERLLATLGSRLLEQGKKVGETAEAIELRQSGETSALGSIAANVSESLTQILRWVYWWNSTEDTPEAVSKDQVSIQLNTDFSTKTLSAQELTAIVAAWQAGAITHDTMLDLFRRGEVMAENDPATQVRKPARLADASRPNSRTPIGVPSE